MKKPASKKPTPLVYNGRYEIAPTLRELTAIWEDLEKVSESLRKSMNAIHALAHTYKF